MVTFSIILCLIFYYWFYDYLADYIYYNVTSHLAIENFEVRTEAFFEGIRLIRQKINWFGESNRYFISGWRIIENTELSNGFVNIITTRGMISFILYSFLWFLSFYSLYRSRLYDTLLVTLLVFLLLYLFIVENITQLNFQNMILFYVFTGFSLSRFIFKKEEVSNE